MKTHRSVKRRATFRRRRNAKSGDQFGRALHRSLNSKQAQKKGYVK